MSQINSLNDYRIIRAKADFLGAVGSVAGFYALHAIVANNYSGNSIDVLVSLIIAAGLISFGIVKNAALYQQIKATKYKGLISFSAKTVLGIVAFMIIVTRFLETIRNTAGIQRISSVKQLSFELVLAMIIIGIGSVFLMDMIEVLTYKQEEVKNYE